MGASVIAYWPGITEQQIEEQPGFYNDSKAWGNWMAEREEEPEVGSTPPPVYQRPNFVFQH